MTAREAALLTLTACEKQGAWAEGYLKRILREAGLDRRDAALATRLCYGVLQNRTLLDFYIASYSTLPVEKMESKVRNSLRLGAYQIIFLSRIPQSAAVNESVALVRIHCKNPRAGGMVNAILRAIARNADNLPRIDQSDQEHYLAVRYSHPDWIVKEWCLTVGLAETEQLLQADNREPQLVAQVNTLKTTAPQAAAALEGEGVTAAPHPWLPNCLVLSGTGDLEGLDAYQKGLFYIQDSAGRLAVTAAGITPGMAVLDACAAPGGKSFAAAIDLENRGELLSCDIHSHKVHLIEQGGERLGINCLTASLLDGKRHNPKLAGRFDVVLADVPCSGLGVIGKKPEIRFKQEAELGPLPTIQRALLDNLSTYVAPGGSLVYSTCTLLQRENEDVVEGFLAEHPEFCAEGFCLPGPAGEVASGVLTLWPQRHGTDGFFIAKLRRVEA